MASGVNVKMGVSGVAKFKQDMNQAKSAVKTLDAQLALTEKQFKQTGDAESYVAEKTELLKAKMEAQKRVIANAEQALQAMTEKGVDRASKAYQDMYQQMINAKGALIDTETALGNIGTAAEEADQGVSDMNESLKGIDKKLSYDMVLDGLSTITSGIEKVISKAWELGAALVRNTLGAGAWADELKETAEKYEISPEDLQRMRKTEKIIDTSTDAILSAKNKMKQVIGSGGNTATDALEALGLGTIVETDPEEQFWKIGEAIMNLGDAYQRENAAQKLFGRSWRELLPLFNAGREEYEKTNASWSVLEEDQLDGLSKMDDQYQKMQSEFETFKMELLSAFSGPMTEGMETITNLFKELNDYLDTPEGQAMLKQIGDTVSSLISDLTNINPEDVVNSLKEIVDGITEGLRWIDEHKDEVVTAIEAIAIAFGGLKIAMLGINIAKVVNGAKSLLGGGNGATGGGGTAGEAGTASTASGGFLTGLWNKAAAAAPAAANWISLNGAPVVDWLTHESPIAGLLNGTETAEEFFARWSEKFSEESVQAFKDNWDPTNPDANVLAKGVDWLLTGGNHEDFEETDWSNDPYDLTAAIERMTDEIENGNDREKAKGPTKEDLDDFKKTPGLIENAVKAGMAGIKIYMDGEQISAIVSQYQGAGVYADVNP